MGKIIIYNTSSLSDIDALELVQNVIKMGRISNDNKQYCYLSVYTVDNKKIGVQADLNKQSDKFHIYNRT